MRPKVRILLSTYNGEKFIKEQLDSLLAQTEKSIHIEVRDDGSTDKTVSILKSYESEHPGLFTVRVSPNCGVKNSFLKLLKESGESDFYSFSDQDDIWMTQKLEFAIQELEKHQDKPAIYVCRQELIDQNGQYIGESPSDFELSFSGALVECLAWGCTLVFNKAARDLVVLKDFDPNKIISHDWWVYLVVSAHGHLISDSRTMIGYRQHGNNDNGLQTHFLRKFLFRLKRLKRNGVTKWSRQAIELERLYGDSLSKNHRKTLQLILKSKQCFMARVQLITSDKIKRYSTIDSMIIRIITLLGIY